MAYDFDAVIDRRHSDSAKWAFPESCLSADEAAADPLPMWVADMDFKAPQPVIDALKAAADRGMFGYPGVTKSYLDAVVGWQRKRFGWDVPAEWVLQTPGVVTALNTVIQALSRPGDSVLVQTPVYVHFHQDAINNGRQVVYAPLTVDGDRYRFDAKVFEAAIQPNTKLFILCNPQNPTGTVWSEDELRQMGEICARRNVLVVSDEIHEDLVFNRSKKHVPFGSLGPKFADNSIVCTAPSKTFNIPGLQCSNIIVANPEIRAELGRQLTRNGLHFINNLGMVAGEAAYRHGEPWLEALLDYLKGNQEHFAAEIAKSLPQLKVFKADGLYLAWMDCRALGMDPQALEKFMLTKARVWFDKGQKFGPEGHGFMRVNLGCPRATVDECLSRLKRALA